MAYLICLFFTILEYIVCRYDIAFMSVLVINPLHHFSLILGFFLPPDSDRRQMDRVYYVMRPLYRDDRIINVLYTDTDEYV